MSDCERHERNLEGAIEKFAYGRELLFQERTAVRWSLDEIRRLRALNAKLIAACEAGLRYHEAIEAMNPSPFVPEPEAVWERNAALYREWYDKAKAALVEAREADKKGGAP